MGKGDKEGEGEEDESVIKIKKRADEIVEERLGRRKRNGGEERG